MRTFHSAVSAYERALDAVPNHTRARRGLARLYWSELQRARHRGEALDQVAYEQLLREVDDGTFVRELQRDGLLELTFGAHAGARHARARSSSAQRRLVEGTRRGDRRSARRAHRSLAAGRYVVTATIGDGTGTRVVAGQHRAGRAVQDRGRAAGAVPHRRRTRSLIPGGPARLGGDPLARRERRARRRRRADVHPPALPGHVRAVVTSSSTTSQHARRSRSQQYRAGARPRGAGAPTDCLRVQIRCASRVRRQRRIRRGLRALAVGARRPARGGCRRSTSGRRRGAAPTVASIRGATTSTRRSARCAIAARALPLAEPIGTFEWDVSPYGVRDLAGGVADWCIPDHRRTAPREPREVVSRGGAWCDWAIDCRLASRRRYLANEHSARVGVRLGARSVTSRRTMENLHSGDLTIEVSVSPDAVFSCTWRGKSNERNPPEILKPWFEKLLAAVDEKKGSIEMHFEKIEHFNSSTITALIKLIQVCRKANVKLVMVYDQSLKWQRLSFDALRVFEKNDDLFHLRFA